MKKSEKMKESEELEHEISGSTALLFVLVIISLLLYERLKVVLWAELPLLISVGGIIVLIIYIWSLASKASKLSKKK